MPRARSRTRHVRVRGTFTRTFPGTFLGIDVCYCLLTAGSGRPHALDGIAAALSLSPRPARNHLSDIFAKLHVADRVQPCAAPGEAGLTD